MGVTARSATWACCLLLCPTLVLAEPGLPFGDQPARYDADEDALLVAATGWPTALGEPPRAAFLSARARGTRRALKMLHALVDEALARRGAPPRLASEVHEVVAHRSELLGLRPLPDRAVIVVMRLPAVHLRTVAPGPDLPWHR